MRPRWKVLGTIVLALLLVALVGPFLVPVPPLEGTLPPEGLADAGSRFVEVNGLRVHYKEAGAGEPVLILLHGFGASLFSWEGVMGQLSGHARVIAFDRPAFGLTERPLPGEWGGENPYSPQAQVDLVFGLMDALGVERAILAGNSAGGTVALNAAFSHPERVQALILVDAAIYTGGGSPDWARPLLATPQMRHLGPLIARRIREQGRAFIERAWHDPAAIPPETYAGYERPLQAENWDVALWELTAASRPPGLAERLPELDLPVLVVSGDDDRIVPTSDSLRLGEEIPGAQVVIFPECGHVPHEECPQDFLEAVIPFVKAR